MGCHKGFDLRKIVKKNHLKSAIYIGDDTTDIDAFSELKSSRSGGNLNGFSTVVVPPNSNLKVDKSADISLEDLPGVRSFLSWLTKICRGGFHPH